MSRSPLSPLMNAPQEKRCLMGKIVDMTGRKCGRLTVIAYLGLGDKNQAIWKCLCDCGTFCTANGSGLNKGSIRSCGCIRRTHGLSKFKIYRTWTNMKARCFNPKEKAYPDYGGRGITVCDRWMKFENFHKDMGDHPLDMFIERRDVNGNYEPSNCYWATRTQQQRNTRRTPFVMIEGERLALGDAIEKYSSVSYGTVHGRLWRGWSPIDAIMAPMQKRR